VPQAPLLSGFRKPRLAPHPWVGCAPRRILGLACLRSEVRFGIYITSHRTNSKIRPHAYIRMNAHLAPHTNLIGFVESRRPNCSIDFIKTSRACSALGCGFLESKSPFKKWYNIDSHVDMTVVVTRFTTLLLVTCEAAKTPASFVTSNDLRLSLTMSQVSVLQRQFYLSSEDSKHCQLICGISLVCLGKLLPLALSGRRSSRKGRSAQWPSQLQGVPKTDPSRQWETSRTITCCRLV